MDDDFDRPRKRPLRELTDDELWDMPPPSSVPVLHGEIVEDDEEEVAQTAADLAHYTPAMLRVKGPDGLTPRQRIFVTDYIATQGNGSEAARRAGVSEASAHVVASRWLRAPAVIDALRTAIGARYVTIAPAMQAQMLKLAISSKSDFVKQQAAKDLLDRAGVAAPVDRPKSVSITVNLD